MPYVSTTLLYKLIYDPPYACWYTAFTVINHVVKKGLYISIKTISRHLLGINVPDSIYTKDWSKVVNNSVHSDVTFHLGTKVFYAHKYMLCCASEFFRSLLLAKDVCNGKVAGIKRVQNIG